MTILVIGSGEPANRVAVALEVYHHPVQRCGSMEMAAPLLDQCAERYSLILAEHDGDSQALSQHVATRDDKPPVVVIGTPGQACSAWPGVAPMCSIQRGDDGSHQLRCALSGASAQPARPPEPVNAFEDQPITFAYSAPVRQRR